jgi:hypothetical protein
MDLKNNYPSGDLIPLRVEKHLLLFFRRQFLQVLEMGPDVKDDELNLKYDRYWLAVLKNTNHLLSVEKKNRLALAFSLLAVLRGKLGCGSGFKGMDQFRFQNRKTDTVSCVDFALQFWKSVVHYLLHFETVLSP